jgi:hypothetical protein
MTRPAAGWSPAAPEGSGRVSDAGPAFDIIDADLGALADSMASLISFLRATAEVVARERGIRLLKSQFGISAELDGCRFGELGDLRLAGFGPGVTGLRVRAELTADASQHELAGLRSETERRCPMLHVVRRSGVAVTSEWTLRPLADPA